MIGLRQIAHRHRGAEDEAGRKRQHHARRRRDERGAPEVLEEAQIGLEPRQEQQQHHAERADDLEQVELRRLVRKDRRERRRCVVTEHRRPEDDAGGQLADDRGQADALGRLGPEPRHDQEDRHLHQQQKDGVACKTTCAALSSPTRPLGWVYQDPAIGQQEALERAIFMQPGVAEQFLGGLERVGAGRRGAHRGHHRRVHVQRAERADLAGSTPGYLDAIGAGFAILADRRAEYARADERGAAAEARHDRHHERWSQKIGRWHSGTAASRARCTATSAPSSASSAIRRT